MKQPDYSSDGEFAATVAAAAYAIHSLEEDGSLNQKTSTEGLGRTVSKIKSKREEGIPKPTDSIEITRWFSLKQPKGRKSEGESSLSKSSTFDKTSMKETMYDRKPAEKATKTTPSIKKTPTFSDKHLNETGSKKYGGGEEMNIGARAPSNMKPLASSFGKEKLDRYSMGSNTGDAKADDWEREQMDKIKMRYEKTRTAILEWENEKKTKAKRQLEQKESDLELRRARALQEYRDEVARIDKIAGGAKALADERKRNEELKVLEKAKVIRTTGRVPRTCFCF